jgi:hypothetical protein
LFSINIGSGANSKGAISASTAEFLRDFRTGELPGVLEERDIFCVTWVVCVVEIGSSIPGVETVFEGEKEIFDIRCSLKKAYGDGVEQFYRG